MMKEDEEDVLPFQESSQTQIQQKRSFFEFYANREQHYSRKQKLDLCTFGNIQGFLSLFDITHQSLHFFDLEALGNQIHFLMQASQYFEVPAQTQIAINQNQFILILKGRVWKQKSSSALTFTTQLIQAIFPLKRKLSRKNTQNSSNNMKRSRRNALSRSLSKTFVQELYVMPNQPPLILTKESSNEQINCTSLNDVQYFRIFQTGIRKIAQYLQFASRDSLIKFISTSLGLEKNRRILKLLPFVQKNIYEKKHKIPFNPKHINMVYQGGLILKYNPKKKIYVKQFGVIVPDQQYEWEGDVQEKQTIIISLELKLLLECFRDDEQILSKIERKIKEVKENRSNAVKSVSMQIYSPTIQPIISSDAFAFRMLNKDRDLNKNVHHKPVQSSYFRVFSSNSINSKNNVKVEHDCSVFMRNFPYEKIVESYDKINTRKNNYEPHYTEIRKQNHAKLEEHFKKIKGQKYRKHQYHMNKVRKLKIKNIAEKTIPVLNNKQSLNMENAEKQITDCSLFSTYIQFPTKGGFIKKNVATEGHDECDEIYEVNTRKIQVFSQSKSIKGCIKSKYIKFNNKSSKSSSSITHRQKNNLSKNFSSTSFNFHKKEKSMGRMTTEITDDCPQIGKGKSYEKMNRNKIKRKYIPKSKKKIKENQKYNKIAEEKEQNILKKRDMKTKGIRRPLTSFILQSGSIN